MRVCVWTRVFGSLGERHGPGCRILRRERAALRENRPLGLPWRPPRSAAPRSAAPPAASGVPAAPCPTASFLCAWFSLAFKKNRRISLLKMKGSAYQRRSLAARVTVCGDGTRSSPGRPVAAAADRASAERSGRPSRGRRCSREAGAEPRPQRRVTGEGTHGRGSSDPRSSASLCVFPPPCVPSANAFHARPGTSQPLRRSRTTPGSGAQSRLRGGVNHAGSDHKGDEDPAPHGGLGGGGQEENSRMPLLPVWGGSTGCQFLLELLLPDPWKGLGLLPPPSGSPPCRTSLSRSNPSSVLRLLPWGSIPFADLQSFLRLFHQRPPTHACTHTLTRTRAHTYICTHACAHTHAHTHRTKSMRKAGPASGSSSPPL